MDVSRLKERVWGRTIKGILSYLGVDYQNIDPIEFYDKVFEKNQTTSTESNKVGQYKKYFNEKHYELVLQPERSGIIKAFGYGL